MGSENGLFRLAVLAIVFVLPMVILVVGGAVIFRDLDD